MSPTFLPCNVRGMNETITQTADKTATQPSLAPQTSRALIGRIWRDYLSDYRKFLLIAAGCMVLVAAAAATNAYMMEPVLDDVFIRKDKSLLLNIVCTLFAIALIAGLANYGQNVCMRYVGQKIIARMQYDLFAHLVHADLATFHQHTSGRLISRFTNDINMMRLAVSTVLTGIAKEMLSGVFLIALMIYQSWELSVIALVLFPTAILPILRLGRRMRKLSGQVQGELGELTANLDDVFQNVREVKVSGAENREMNRAKTIIDRLFVYYFKAARVQVAASPMMETLGGVMIASVIGYGGLQVIEENMTTGAFFSFITAMILAYKPLKSMAGLNNHLQEGLAAAQRFFAILDTKRHIENAENAHILDCSKNTDIEFEQINFTYDGAEETAGLNDISFTVPHGKTVALVGASGGGKTTVMNLLMRLYEVDSGALRIAGQSVDSVTLESLRANMALVSQDVLLFNASIADNIAYARPSATQDEIIEAAKAANAHTFIESLENGYDTAVGPRGVKLSGGQKQRIAIARAILKNAPILLLDEATSALDNESERLVQESLNALMQDRTTLIIAHRLSTIQHADTILVLDGGKIVESGTHAELIGKNGSYAELYGKAA